MVSSRSSKWICSQKRKGKKKKVLLPTTTSTLWFVFQISYSKYTFSPSQTTANILVKWHFKMMQFESLLMFSLATITLHKQHLSSKVPLNYLETDEKKKKTLLLHTSLWGFAWRSSNTRHDESRVHLKQTNARSFSQWCHGGGCVSSR